MPNRPIITRFAPSPTGYLHIGGGRTALFNWLYARGRGGKFLLRIEDTDRERSTPEATAAILRGLTWLGLDWDGDAIFQFARMDRHAAVAFDMLARGSAYKCFCTQEEIEAFRAAAEAGKRSTLFQSPWRTADPATHPDKPFVIRIKAPRNGVTVIGDQVLGRVTFGNDQLDDMVCLRSDGTPTYMLAVVVDDHDMGVTHVIRGNEHLNNAARQTMIYQAMGWDVPVWAHLPLINGADGKKLSKRHGALGVEEYQSMGYPAAGMRNYLTRLGWSHGDDEVFTSDQAAEWFDFKGIGRAPAQFDFKKLENICGKHIAAADDAALLHEILEFVALHRPEALDDQQRDGLLRAMYCLKDRAKTFHELLDKAYFIISFDRFDRDAASKSALDVTGRGILLALTLHLHNTDWTRPMLEAAVAEVAAAHGVNLGKLAQPLRAALAGRTVSPSVFDMMLVLGRDETIARLSDAASADGTEAV